MKAVAHLAERNCARCFSIVGAISLVGGRITSETSRTWVIPGLGDPVGAFTRTCLIARLAANPCGVPSGQMALPPNAERRDGRGKQE